MMTNDIELLTVKEVQKILKVSRSKAYSFFNSGKVRVIRIGKNIRIDKKDLYDYLNT